MLIIYITKKCYSTENIDSNIFKRIFKQTYKHYWSILKINTDTINGKAQCPKKVNPVQIK
jgi:hypothetical protein